MIDNEALRAKYNPEGSLLRRDQMEMLRMLKVFAKICKEHDITWWHHCWFCQYMRNNASEGDEGCQRCPLADKTDDDVMSGRETGCNQGIYRDVLKGETVAIRVAACNKIIQALLGKNPYEED